MANLDHTAIRKAYPSIVVLDDSFVDYGLDSSGNKVSIVQSNVDTARAELDKLKYQIDRVSGESTIYGSWREQMAMLYDDIIAGKLDATGSFAIHNKAVKDANPKPS